MLHMEELRNFMPHQILSRWSHQGGWGGRAGGDKEMKIVLKILVGKTEG